MPISQWIRASSSSYDANTGFFENHSKIEDLPIQSPISLSKSFRYFIVTQERSFTNRWKRCKCWIGYLFCKIIFPLF